MLPGATGHARDLVIVYDNAAGTPKPEGGTYGTSGSATTAIQADGFTAAHVTFANDWLRAALARDVAFRPYGFVFAPSTAAADPHGHLAVRCVINGTAADASFGLARPWRPSSDPTAIPSLVVRKTLMGSSIAAYTARRRSSRPSSQEQSRRRPV
ncbi:hypothetical protein JOL79_30655 [Microbispora sp. RL4-1S]|uniref:Uncharacterized protein n=1 Tax=Microbispora oryzae TaxID=2806554 RepID=A0A941ASF1_9ACTN|nr:hypothetical protein [Microbispora oryzae]MBP2708149.1 hypothetical protein [Microbispora oryzae]